MRRSGFPSLNSVVASWDRLAEICGQFLGKGQQVAIEGSKCK
jgi:single-stranded DNA-binding protein